MPASGQWPANFGNEASGTFPSWAVREYQTQGYIKMVQADLRTLYVVIDNMIMVFLVVHLILSSSVYPSIKCPSSNIKFPLLYMSCIGIGVYNDAWYRGY